MTIPAYRTVMPVSLRLLVIFWSFPVLLWSQWQTLTDDQPFPLNDIIFVDAQHGFAVGDNGFFLRSGTNDQLWVVYNIPGVGDLETVIFTDTLAGYIINTKGKVFGTEDGGIGWRRVRDKDIGLVINDLLLRRSENLYAYAKRSVQLELIQNGTNTSPVTDDATDRVLPSTIYLTDRLGTFIGSYLVRGAVERQKAKPKTVATLPFGLFVTVSFSEMPLIEILEVLQNKYPVTFYYDPDRLPYYPQTYDFANQTLREVLNTLLIGTSLGFSNLGEEKIVILPKNQLSRENAENLVMQWESGAIRPPTSEAATEQTFTFGSPEGAPAKVRLRGRVLDDYTADGIIGATLLVSATGQGTATDAFGNYELELPSGMHEILLQYVGFQSQLLTVHLYEDATLDLSMRVNPLEIQEVIVEAKGENENIRSANIGVQQLSTRELRELPAFLGETDVIQSVKTLAGVTTVGDGAQGFNVRGGNIDQNLILLDGTPVFNSAHALGFFSAFNGDLIDGVTLYKGNIPAQYGSRLSSVLQVDTKDGNYRKFNAAGGVGLVSSRLMINGPIIKDKTSIIAGGRVSYVNWVLNFVDNEDVRNSRVFFYDLNAKLTHRFNDRNFLIVNTYRSDDAFQFANDFGFAWGTQIWSARYRSLFSDRFSVSLLASTARYRNEQYDPVGFDAFTLTNALSYDLVEPTAFLALRNHDLNFGFSMIRYRPDPERLDPRIAASFRVPEQVERDRANEYAVFINDELRVNEALALSVGLRYSTMHSLGEHTVFTYEPDAPRSVFTIADTLLFADGERIAQYDGLEPRVSVNVQLTERTSIKAGYNIVRQYIHLVSNAAAATPADVWQVSNRHIRPMTATSYSIGWFQNSANNLWRSSLEFYYKDVTNLLTYKDFADLIVNPNLETELVQGEGRAYGFELSVEKREGKWSGRFNFTWSRSLIRTQSIFPEEQINGNFWFPANFDQPHQLNLSLRHQINPVHALNLNFTYRTGRPISAPVATYVQGFTVIPNYSFRNQFRIPAYHRLDVGYTVDNTKAKLKGYRSSWALSFYNLYARRNAFSIYFQRDDRNQQQAYRLAVLGTMFPAITYNFIF